VYFGKNVSFKAANIEIIQGFQHKTRKNFSQTLNIIIEQWDKFSIEIQKFQEKLKIEKQVKDIKKAKVIKK